MAGPNVDLHARAGHSRVRPFGLINEVAELVAARHAGA